MAKKSDVLKSFPKMLPVALTPAELQTRGNKLAHVEADLEAHLIKAKTVRAALREDGKSISLEIARLAKSVREKSEEREVTCEVRPSKKAGYVDEVRADTGEVLATRKLEDADAQGDLLDAPEAEA